VFNRYVVDVIIEYFLWLLKHPGPPRSGRSPLLFVGDVVSFTLQSIAPEAVHQSARDHLKFRSSAVFLMWTLAETIFVTTYFDSSDPAAKVLPSPIGYAVAGVIFVFGVLQIIIVRRLDFESVRGGSSKKIRH
jgi:hypothetical protein